VQPEKLEVVIFKATGASYAVIAPAPISDEQFEKVDPSMVKASTRDKDSEELTSWWIWTTPSVPWMWISWKVLCDILESPPTLISPCALSRS
jgi:hypothetical protein